MRKSLISLLIAIFFLILLFIITTIYPPFDSEGMNNIIQRYGITEEDEFKEVVLKSIELGVAWEFIHLPNLIAWLVSLGGAVIAFCASVHLFIDKLFFKKFFEQPDLQPAIRRGTLVFFVLFVLLMLKLLGALVWYTVVIAVLLLVCFEVGVVYLKRN